MTYNLACRWDYTRRIEGFNGPAIDTPVNNRWEEARRFGAPETRPLPPPLTYRTFEQPVAQRCARWNDRGCELLVDCFGKNLASQGDTPLKTRTSLSKKKYKDYPPPRSAKALPPGPCFITPWESSLEAGNGLADTPPHPNGPGQNFRTKIPWVPRKKKAQEIGTCSANNIFPSPSHLCRLFFESGLKNEKQVYFFAAMINSKTRRTHGW